jgi:RimJ/RimL family protein N-acetyltransferase
MILTGVKVLLREWRFGDLDTLRHWMQPGHLWQETDGPYYGQPTPEQVEIMVARLRRRIEATVEENLPSSMVVALSDDRRFAGQVTWRWHGGEMDWPEVGIGIFDSSLWGNGLGYEALGLWTDFVFSRMPDMVRLDLRTWSGHTGMIRLATKLGFVEEARYRRARVVKGERYDGLSFGVLREEWQGLFPHGFAASLVRSG